MAIKLKRTLYVGIGGTGVETLLKVKKNFIDIYGEVPPMIGFLAIDTDNGALGKSVKSNLDEPIRLSQSELLVCTAKGALMIYNINPNTYDWVPRKNVAALAGIQGGGAGQVRSNGRFIAIYNHRNIENAINAAVTNIKNLIPADSKFKVDTNDNGVEQAVHINVVASIAGGTGSGMLIDVLYIIRNCFDLTENIKLYPWIVLPEIFRSMSTGPSMANVLYNSYGALRTLDYFRHHDPNSPAINFGYGEISNTLFDYAYLINNTNSAGTTFKTLDDLTDVMAKSMFLPANEMGTAIASPFDNIQVQQMAGTYDILNKKAWAASASSAELLYDSQAVGRVYAYRTIGQLCASMLQSPTDGTVDANNFVDDPDVMIRENNGRNDIIDALLSPGVEYELNIDENTSQNDINFYLNYHCDQLKLADKMNANLNKKLDVAKTCLDKYLEEIMSRPQGKVNAAIKFIGALLDIINLCKDEMTKEAKELADQNQIPVQWPTLLNSVPATGIRRLMSKIDDEAVEILKNKLTEVVTNNREEIRRNWALKFYSAFESVINEKLQGLQSLKSEIKKIADKSTKILLTEKQNAESISNFQIFLHTKDIDKASRFEIDENIKADFVTYLKGGIFPWIGQSFDYIDRKLWNFAKETAKVKEAVNTDIDNVLRALSEEEVKTHLDRLKLLASPLWTYNTQGYTSTAQQLDKFVVVGVGSRDTSILKTDARYSSLFNIGTNQASFASTNQNDRVYVLVVEDLLPIYAVNNFKAYEYDHQEKLGRNVSMVNYLDENLNNRMNAENFGIMPLIEKDDVLNYWVMGFVFGIIHFDKERDTYWIRSRSKGEAVRGYRYDLSRSREVAYDFFKSQQLYKEVEETINNMIARDGKNSFDNKVEEIKRADGKYFNEICQLSPLERDNIDNAKFKAVKDLVEQETRLMSY